MGVEAGAVERLSVGWETQENGQCPWGVHLQEVCPGELLKDSFTELEQQLDDLRTT